MPIDQKVGTAQLLFRAAHNMGLRPSWVVDNGLFAVTVNDKEEYVNYARSPLNTAVGVSLAKNKYFTRMVLARHNVRNIPFARPSTLEAAQVFLQKHGKIIAKPLEGSGSRDIHIITNSAQLVELEIKKYILEKYIQGKELRYLVLNDTILAVYESEYGSSVAVDRPLQCIAYARAAWDDRLSKESLLIADALRLRFAAVDYIVESDGNSYVLEVNTMPDLRWFHAPSSGPIVDVATYLMETLYETKPRRVRSVSGIN